MKFHVTLSQSRLFLLLVVCLLALPVFAGTTTRVSVASDGTQGNNSSGDWGASISADGRYIAFESNADNLVPDDTNNYADIFVHDRVTGQTERVSVASDDTQGNKVSSEASISADGRYVAFYSSADNLVPDDTNNYADIFVHDRVTGQTERVSVASDGTEANNTTYSPSISADGRYVAFCSWSSNLAPGDTNGCGDIYLHDRTTGQTEQVSVTSDGQSVFGWSTYPTISADGRYVVFMSETKDLVPGDTNGVRDIFVHDRATGLTERVNVASNGMQGNNTSGGSSISADGRYVAFNSLASNLVPEDTNSHNDVFVHDRTTGQTERVSVSSDGTQGNDNCIGFSISADGRYVEFYSLASNLVSGDTNSHSDVFVHDRTTGQTERVSVSSDGMQENDNSYNDSISTDGRYVAFRSGSSNLVPGDTNGCMDVFVRDRAEQPLTTVSLDASPDPPQLKNTPITLTADITGGWDVEMKFRAGYQDATGWHWSDLTDYQTTATCTWTPTAAHDYTLMVWAREVGESVDFDVSASMAYQITNPPLTAVALTANPVPPHVVGPVTLIATPTGGSNVEFKYRCGYQDAAGWHWNDLTNYQSMTTCTWLPSGPRTYTLVMWAREVGSTKSYDVYGTLTYVTKLGLEGVGLAVQPASPQLVNTPLTLTATAYGGDNPVFRFYAGAAIIRDFSPAKTCVWTPTVAGNYSLRVAVRDRGGANPILELMSNPVPFAIKPALSTVSLATAPPAPQVAGTPVMLTVTATGGARVEYRFRAGYQDVTGWHWSDLTGYTQANTCVWTPSEARAYTLIVWAREAGHTISYDRTTPPLLYRATATPITAVSLAAAPPAPQLANTPITLTAGATGGYAVEYKFRAGYQDAAGWHWSDLTNYQTTPTCTWTPTTARAYTVVVYAREVGSTIAYLKYTSQDYKVTAQ